VRLLDDTCSAYGPFFLLQVKTTERFLSSGRSIPARFSEEEVASAKASLVPVYLVGVECLDDDTEEVYAIAVDVSLDRGLAAVPKLFSLRKKEIRMMIYREVQDYFNSAPCDFRSALTREAYAANLAKEASDE